MWVKSSFSASNQNCLEVWRTSSACQTGECIAVASWRKSRVSLGNSDCVEVAHGARVRDSKLGDASPVLAFGPAAWSAFTERLKTQL